MPRQLERLPYFRFHSADYLIDTAGLTQAQHGAYCLLLVHYYWEGKLPEDQAALYSKACAFDDAGRSAVDVVVARYFHRENGELLHNRVERELDSLHALMKQRSKAGLRSAEVRAAKRTAKTKPDAEPTKKPNGSNVAEQVLAYLNERTGSRFRPVKANVALIEARIKEGATQDDLKSVIDKKCGQWLNDGKWSKYLRPGTLFNREKFAQYQGEAESREREHRLVI